MATKKSRQEPQRCPRKPPRRLVREVIFASPAALAMKPGPMEVAAIGYAVMDAMKGYEVLPADMFDAIATETASRFAHQWLAC